MDPLTIITVAGVTATLGIALGFLLGRHVWAAPPSVDAAAYALSKDQLARSEVECVTLNKRVQELQNDCQSSVRDLSSAREEVARLTERVATLGRQLADQSELARQAASQRDAIATEMNAASAEIARLTERENALAERIAKQTEQLAAMQKQLTTEFENIANRVLKASTTELSDTSQKNLEALLEPLRQRLKDFQERVETAYDAEKREVLSLKEQIRAVIETSHAIGSQADGLAKALRGDTQLLGRWGEVTLERILETAGLQEGREFITQGRGLKLKSDDGSQQKPDVVILLPENRTLVIDSKVTLNSYEALIRAENPDERAKLGEHLVRDVKAHINGLGGKRYQDNPKLQSHDAVLMFVPIEGALAAALTADPELFVYAWDKGVVLVGPPTLLMTMRTVASIWRYELQAQNAQQIAGLAGELCDKISHSLMDLNGVTEKMNAAVSAHNLAVKRLSTGKGNALSIGARIRQLGVKTKRPVPPVIVDGLPIVIPIEDDETETTIDSVDQNSANSSPSIAAGESSKE